MDPAFAKTVEFLAKTANQAAIAALLPGLDSANQAAQIGALQALLDRRDPIAQKAVLQRIDQHRPGWDDMLLHKHGRLNQALRDAVAGNDPAACSSACRAIVRYREYDLIPTMITVAEAVDTESSEVAAAAILELAEHLYEDLHGPRNYSDRRDPQFIRRVMVGHLEKSAERYPEHHCKEIIEAFLLLTTRDNAVLQAVLYDPHHPCYLPIVDILAHGRHLGITCLLLDFLDCNQTPAVVLSTISHRRDREFVRRLVARWRDHITPAMRSNVRRIESYAWADPAGEMLSQFDERDQIAVLNLLVASGTSRHDALAIVRHFFENGTGTARHAAMKALEDFPGAAADSLVSKALRDADPALVVLGIGQARARNIPGAMPKLVGLADSPHESVRQAVHDSLSEFHFDRFWAAFELMEEEARSATGELVRRIDPTYMDRIREELSSTKRSRRIRAAAIAAAMGVAPRVEEQLLQFIEDDDELVREEMAKALGGCNSPEVRDALRATLEDRFPSVREAARASLKQIEQQPEPRTSSSPGLPNVMTDDDPLDNLPDQTPTQSS